jgi:TonB family protein
MSGILGLMGIRGMMTPTLFQRFGFALALSIALGARAGSVTQSPAPTVAANASAASDPTLREAEAMIGKSLFLRGFYSGNELRYDAAGKVKGTPGTTDWTLAGVNVLKVMRRGPTEIEMDGVRVAIRYNPDAHEFQRHPLNDEGIKIVLADPGNGTATETALAEMFSFGIDPALQTAMPDLWRHYFDQSLAWPDDGLNAQTVYPLYGQPDQPKDVTPPKPAQMSEPRFTPSAERDRVQGSVVLRVVVDANGSAKRIWLARPLGYGLDVEAVKAVRTWRFTPAMRSGSPVAAGVYVEQKFVLPPPRR